MLRGLGARVAEADAIASDLHEQRARIVAHFDGQEGMTRQAMAEALGISVNRIQQLVASKRPTEEAEPHPVQMPDSLRLDLEAALSAAEDNAEAITSKKRARDRV